MKVSNIKILLIILGLASLAPYMVPQTVEQSSTDFQVTTVQQPEIEIVTVQQPEIQIVPVQKQEIQVAPVQQDAPVTKVQTTGTTELTRTEPTEYLRTAPDNFIRVGDIVKIKKVGGPNNGKYLYDNNGKAAVGNLIATDNKFKWRVQRAGAAVGTVINSGTFPKLQNVGTGRYLGGSGYPIVMGTTNYGDYPTNQFWTPVNITNNTEQQVDAILNKFRSMTYPNQYSLVLYPMLKGNTALPGSSIKLNTTIDTTKTITFISNGGMVLSNSATNIFKTVQVRDVTSVSWGAVSVGGTDHAHWKFEK